MRLLGLRLALLAISVGAMVLVAGTSSAFATATTCTVGASSGNVETCMYVNGSGLHINSATASAHVVNVGRKLSVCMNFPPPVFNEICTPYTVVSPGQTLSKSWNPNAPENAGPYCATTWRENANSSVTQIGHTCVNVHS
jgi:hypothetical protein